MSMDNFRQLPTATSQLPNVLPTPNFQFPTDRRPARAPLTDDDSSLQRSFALRNVGSRRTGTLGVGEPERWELEAGSWESVWELGVGSWELILFSLQLQFTKCAVS